ncbi:MAG: hypothetical protein KF753_04945 [Caldilineaceae bacterium]|nr:hypothetical protein [Caldilineaceae bacterium]
MTAYVEYSTLAELQAAYAAGVLATDKNPVKLDNGVAYVYAEWGDEGDWDKVYDSDSENLLRAALDLLGIPWRNA